MMEAENKKTKELLQKFMSEKYSEDELLELFEKANTEELDQALIEILPQNLDQIDITEFTKEEIRESFFELSRRIGLRESLRKVVFRKVLRYAAIISIPLMLGILGTFFFQNDFSSKEDSKLVFSMSRGNKGFMELTDGSKVWLNSSSKLFYGATNPREVQLDGEAYFEIAPDKKNRFKVKTGYFDIVVYGTAFNVSTYQTDNTVEVDLIEGSIGIVDNERSLFKLEPGQAVLYNKIDKHYTIIERNMTDVSLWTQPELVIRDMDAKQLYKKLSAWYRVDIDLQNNDPNNRLYNLVITNESLENILSLVDKLSPMEYHINGKEVRIRYK